MTWPAPNVDDLMVVAHPDNPWASVALEAQHQHGAPTTAAQRVIRTARRDGTSPRVVPADEVVG